MKKLIVALIILVGSVFIHSQSVLAAAKPNLWPSGIPGQTDPTPSDMPASSGIYNYLNTCRNGKLSPAFGEWISLSGNPAATSITVDYGTTSINLDFSFNGATCHYSSGSVIRTNLVIDSASGGVGGIVGLQTLSFSAATPPGTDGLTFNAGSPEGTYRLARKGFTYTPPGGMFTSSGDYVVTINTKAINEFPGKPNYRCVQPPGFGAANAASIVDFSNCAVTSTPFTIHVTVRNPVGFTAKGYVDKPTLLPASDAPITGNFVAKVGVTLTKNPPIKVGELTVTRNYYIQHYPTPPGGGNTSPILSPAPNHDYITRPQKYYNLTGQPLGAVVAGDQICQTITVSPSSGQVDSSGTIIPGTGTGTDAPPPACTPIAALPYASVYGNDVFAGGQLTVGNNTNCTVASPSSNIYGFLINSSQGAGSQFAAYATNTIANAGDYGFASSKLRSAAPTAPSGLDMGNTGASLGGFSPGTCSNYPFNPPSANSQNLVTTFNVVDHKDLNNVTVSSLNGLQDGGSYFYDATKPGNTMLEITDAASRDYHNHLTIYVKGNVIIQNDITYADNTSTPSHPWNTPADIPSLTIIASGNILISHDVAAVDGNYIAEQQQPSDTPNGALTPSGAIFTCSRSDGPNFLWNESQLYNECNSQLVVHGRLLANAIFWLRTFGTRALGTTAENPYAGPNPNAAELVISGPEGYIGQSPSNTVGQQVQSITGLPPVL